MPIFSAHARTPCGLRSAGAPNDWRRTLVRVDLPMQLVQKVEHLFGRMVVRSRMSRPSALCSARAPNDWRRAVARVDLNMQLVQKVEHLFGRMGCKHQRCLNTVLAHAPYAHLRCAGAARARRTSGDGQSALRSLRLRILVPCKTIKGKENGAKHRKRDRASGQVARPVRSIGPKGRSCARTEKTSFSNLLFADLVVMAGCPHPFPSRTRP